VAGAAIALARRPRRPLNAGHAKGAAASNIRRRAQRSLPQSGRPTMAENLWCRFCYWACFTRGIRLDRISWKLYLALLPWAGAEAHRRGEL
jgi:hypothetical protein